MPKYKNVSGQKLVIPGVGEVEPGGVIESDSELHNGNLQLVQGVPAQQPTQPVPPQHPQAPATSAAPVHGEREENR
jgi:hypothetical protein